MAETTTYQLIVPAHDNINQIVLNLDTEEQALAFGFLLDGVEGATITKRTEQTLVVLPMGERAGAGFALVDVADESFRTPITAPEPHMPEEASPWAAGTTLASLPLEEPPRDVMFEDDDGKQWWFDSATGWRRENSYGMDWASARLASSVHKVFTVVERS
jgi:hypothetical protein